MKHLLTKGSAEAISRRVLYMLVGLTAVVFLLFYIVGFSRPSLLDPGFNDPVFTPVVLIFGVLLIIGALAVALWSAIRAHRRGGREAGVENGIPVARIARIVVVALVAALLLFFLTGSTAAIRINGTAYAETFWLRAADMFIRTAGLLLIAAIGLAVYMQVRKRK